jgi:hypothetical protein
MTSLAGDPTGLVYASQDHDLCTDSVVSLVTQASSRIGVRSNSPDQFRDPGPCGITGYRRGRLGLGFLRSIQCSKYRGTAAAV